jgi:hypothetical protein
MKKIFYVTIIALFASACFSSCTEEEIKPQSTTCNGGGSASDPPK